MSDFADGIIEDLKERLRPVADEVAADVAADLRDSVSVPVGYAGRRVIRSAPGEPPRKETGDYQSSIDSVVTVEGDRVSARAFTDSLLGDWLEHGTSRGLAPRPHFAPAYQRWQAVVAERFAEAVGARL